MKRCHITGEQVNGIPRAGVVDIVVEEVADIAAVEVDTVGDIVDIPLGVEGLTEDGKKETSSI